MKAIVYYKYGPPEVVTVTEVSKPTPKDNEVLIQVFASTVNRTDSGFRSAVYFISRFWSGLFKPTYPILGCEFAGQIEAIGKSVTQFKVGDHVFGFNDQTFGGHGEYTVKLESDAICAIPNNMDVRQAAPISEGAHYALCNIRASKIKAGQHALVYGATGSIGSAAVQLLKHFGVRVTAVCNTKNIDLVRSLGAETVIDYQREDFTACPTQFEFIFDAVGKSSYWQCKPLLTSKGVYVSTELGKYAQNIFLAMLTPFFGGKKLLFPIPTIDKLDLEFFKSLVENGEFSPVIDRYYKMNQIVEAYHYVESGEKTGNVVLTILE